MMEYEGKNLQPLKTLSRQEYAKVSGRMVRGLMSRYVIDDTIYYDVDEYNSFTPKKAGRKPKLQAERSTYNGYIVLGSVWTEYFGIVKVENGLTHEKFLIIGEKYPIDDDGHFNSEWDEVCNIIDTGLCVSEKVLKKIL